MNTLCEKGYYNSRFFSSKSNSIHGNLSKTDPKTIRQNYLESHEKMLPLS